MKCYQPEVYFVNEIKDKNKEESVKVVTVSLTKDATFPVTIGGVNCNALNDTGATRSCISEMFYNPLNSILLSVKI